MKKKRTLLFRIGTVLLLLIIAGAMMIIGRGHTVYMDNKTFEYNGQTYESFYKVVVLVDGKQVGKLYDRERAMATNIGQKFDVTFEVTAEKGGDELVYNVRLDLPYNMDGVAINLPTYLAGLSEDAFLSEFVVEVAETEAEEETTVDEFGIGGDI